VDSREGAVLKFNDRVTPTLKTNTLRIFIQNVDETNKEEER
jgi:hypothetical protein